MDQYHLAKSFSSIMEKLLFFGDFCGGAGTTITKGGILDDKVCIVGMGFRFHISLNLFIPLQMYLGLK